MLLWIEEEYYMYCELINISNNDPITFLASIARTCYSELNYSTNYITYKKDSNIKMINHLISSGHHSVLEHLSLTFVFGDVSRAFTHQLVRHRVASYTQRSQRYCDESNFGVTIPESVLNNPSALKRYESINENIRQTYNDLVKLDHINKEDARYILPNACNTAIIATFNLREYIHICQERLCNRAQKEIRDVVSMSLKQLSETNLDLYNIIKKIASPSCYREGKCREFNSCGKPYTGWQIFWDVI